jgi:hypothetical protein
MGGCISTGDDTVENKMSKELEKLIRVVSDASGERRRVENRRAIFSKLGREEKSGKRGVGEFFLSFSFSRAIRKWFFP